MEHQHPERVTTQLPSKNYIAPLRTTTDGVHPTSDANRTTSEIDYTAKVWNGQRIVCGAILFDEGDMLVGARHFDMVMHNLAERYGINRKRSHTQGFIDQRGNFLTRSEAWTVAKVADQIRRHRSTIEGTLYSEDLY